MTGQPLGISDTSPVCDGLAEIVGDHTYAHAAKPDRQSEDDPTASAQWNDGCDFAMIQLLRFLEVDPTTVIWDAATETVDGDVRAVIGNIFRAKFGEDWSLSTAPQPAPDAMREAPTELALLRQFYETAKRTDRYFVEIAQVAADQDARQDYRFYMGLYERELDEAVQKIEDWCKDKAAAPVPSLDGPITTEQLDHLQFGRVLHDRPSPYGAGERIKRAFTEGGFDFGLSPSATGVVDSRSLAHAQAAIERQKNAPPNVDVLAADLVAAGEVEYSGAAEPVAWDFELASAVDAGMVYGGWHYGLSKTKPNVPPGSIRKLRPLYATPPVRGDREAIARIIDPEAFQSLERTYVIPTGHEFGRMKSAKDKADAILSLLVQPNTEAEKK